MLTVVAIFTLVLGYGAFQQGAVTVFDGMLAAAGVGMLACVYYGFIARLGTPPGSRLIFGLCVALTAWVAMQMIPLPFALVRLLSAHRAELETAVRGGQGWTTITVVPAETRIWLIRMGSFLLAMLISRDLAWRFPDRCGYLAIPVLVVAGGEAALGLVQFFSSSSAAGVARGTYVNRDHFAGLLEMAIPLAVMSGVGIYRRGRKRFESSAKSAVLACGLFALATAMLMAVVFSLSRMGFLAALFSLLFVGAVSSSSVLSKRLDTRLRWLPVGLISLAIILTFVYLPTDELIARFAQTGNEDLTADTRVLIWRESVEMVRHAPWAGFGLGSYQSAFYAFKRVAPMSSVAHAHNDYLQAAAELGILGMLPLLLIAGLAGKSALESLGLPRETMQHYLGIGCAGSLFALMLHSLVDFNLYIPANAMTLAWIAGMALGLNLAFRSSRT